MILCRGIDDLANNERVLVLGARAVGEGGGLLRAVIVGLSLNVSGLMDGMASVSEKQPTIVLYTVSKGCSLVAVTNELELRHLPDRVHEGALSAWRQILDLCKFCDVGADGSRSREG